MNFPSSTPAAHGGAQKTTRRWSRHLPWLGGTVLAALIAAGLWPKPLPVETAGVTRGALTVTVDEEGMTRVKNRFLISAPVAGLLRRIDWKAGATVEAGKTVLAVLETPGAGMLDTRTLAQAEAQVRAAEANREAALAQAARAAAATRLAGTEFERGKMLRAQGALSAQEFDAVQMRAETSAQDARAAEFALKVAEFGVEQARVLLQRGQPGGAADTDPLILTSPVDGRILRVLQESARVIPGGFPLMEIGDPAELEARIEVLSRDGVAIPPGARVTLEQWGGPQPLTARVRLVEPSAFTKISALGVEEQRVYVIVDFTGPPEQRATLGDAYRVEAHIVTWEGTSVLKAPTGALFQRSDVWYAYVLEGDTARLRLVKVGHHNGLDTEILSGLAEGDRVIVYPGDRVADGARVRALTVGER
jgi:HlyD family secretion protein